jgi:hypothetical protein
MPTRSAQVPKQYYGYSLQCTESVALLLDADVGGIVSLEVFEDVGVQSATGGTLGVQVKAGTGANPVSDSSVELWKTVRSWIDQVTGKKLALKKCRLELYVAAKKTGKICSEMSAAASAHEVQQVISYMRSKFTSKRTGNIKPSVGDELRSHLEVVLNPKNEEVLREIIARFVYRAGSGRPYDELAAKLEKMFIDSDVVQDVLLHGLGWAKKVLDERIEKDLPAIISVDEFRAEVATFRNKLKSRPYLPSFAGSPSDEEIETNKLTQYVRQLQFIEAEDEDIYEAITDFLTAKANAVEYARRNLINRESLAELAKDLQSTWKNLRQKLQLEGDSKSEIHFGKRLANACLGHRAKLEGLEVPSRFTAGCFHELADVPEIGWHPKYEQLLKEGLK